MLWISRRPSEAATAKNRVAFLLMLQGLRAHHAKDRACEG